MYCQVANHELTQSLLLKTNKQTKKWLKQPLMTFPQVFLGLFKSDTFSWFSHVLFMFLSVRQVYEIVDSGELNAFIESKIAEGTQRTGTAHLMNKRIPISALCITGAHELKFSLAIQLSGLLSAIVSSNMSAAQALYASIMSIFPTCFPGFKKRFKIHSCCIFHL